MSEKRFRANFDVSIYDSETEEYISASENGLKEIAKRMNEQQATIKQLESDKAIAEDYANIFEMENVKLRKKCGESDGENAKLRMENKKLKAKLKEKEEDEQLYANEILELREANKEFIQFKELGGDY